ncbi:uncharacterized protein RAG0_16523 [Rhynchosporium agropyri]|uniref:Uncharacterized protein n=1 Tax=Rhynchosporium agropyri TaxID=914238 RepID=A0A1E1LQR7_9HELO|nr:uncharacterized protein RAG0_16523 [Rhynchosporium agropyri]
MSSERGSSTQDSYNPNIGVQKHARAELKPRKPGPRLKCSFCRDNKKACEPAEYIWPGENCQGCEKLGLLCSEPSEKPLGRRRKRKASQLDLDPDAPRSSLTPGEMTGTFENSEEYVDCYHNDYEAGDESDDDQFDDEGANIRLLIHNFSLWVEEELSKNNFSSFPKTLLQNRILFLEFPDIDIYNPLRFLEGHHKDCLGRVFIQQRLDRLGFVEFSCYEAPDIQAHDSLGRTLLHTICQESNPTVSHLPFYLQTSRKEVAMKLNCKSIFGQQALHYAVATGNLVTSSDLLSMTDIQYDCPDCLDRPPVFYAAANGHLEIMKLLLRGTGIEIDPEDIFGCTPLGMACRNSHERVLSCLTSHGADVKYCNSHTGMTIFGQASVGRNFDIFEFLGSRDDIDVNMQFIPYAQSRKVSPFEEAIGTGFHKGAEFPMERDDLTADVDERGVLKGRYLLCALKNGSADTIDYLVKHPKIGVTIAKYNSSLL